MGADGLKECDIIMKGGVTSGLVYPKAILKLLRSLPFSEHRRHFSRRNCRGIDCRCRIQSRWRWVQMH